MGFCRPGWGRGDGIASTRNPTYAYWQETTAAGLNTFLLDVKGLPVGAYLLQVSYRDAQRQFRVAVKQ